MEEAFAGEKGKRRLEAVARHLEALRLMVSLLRTLANITLVVTVVHLFDVAVDSAWTKFIAPVAVALAVIAVAGVAIPHAWANYAGQRVLAATYTVLLALRYALWPVVAVLQLFDLPIRRLSGVSDDEEENGESAKQEVLHAAAEGQAEGAVDAEEVEMIESVMELDETHAGEIMPPRTDIVALPVEATFADACAKITDAGHTRMPVYEDDLDNIIGVLFAKDLLQYAGQADPPGLREMMRKPFFIPESKALDELLAEFKAGRQHLAVVLDEYGGTAGLVSVEDILEEIVGEISDEYDKPEPEPVTLINETTAEIDGRFYIDDLNDLLSLKIPEDEDYDTAAGLVVSEMGHIPAPGEQIEAYGARFSVLAADERKITRLRVEVLEAGDDARDE
jgi:CBS domain containing-hemolysin-like protein